MIELRMNSFHLHWWISGYSMGNTSQGWSTPTRGRWESGKESFGYIIVGSRFSQSWPRHTLRADLGGQLLRYQRPSRRHLQNSCKHDQRQNTRRNSSSIQYQEWFYTTRSTFLSNWNLSILEFVILLGRTNQKRERVVWRKINTFFLLILLYWFLSY